MLPELLQDRAAIYVSGAMTSAERENFELVLDFHDELRAHVAGLQQVLATVLMSEPAAAAAPPPALKARVLGALGVQPPARDPEGMVVTNGEGLVEWINPAFTAMCGFSLDEIKGRKPGHLLQGPGTDPASVERIRRSLREHRCCREILVNYHKNGSPYRVDIRIEPVLDDHQQPLWFIAKERRLPDDATLGVA
jgi:PAS domain S-box-containing protein